MRDCATDTATATCIFTREDLPNLILETAWQGVKSGGTKAAPGPNRSACAPGMAERTPRALAPYKAAQTTERLACPATITGLPRRSGLSRCSTDA